MMSEIDEKYIEEGADGAVKEKKRVSMRRIGVLAACVAVIAAVCLCIPLMRRGTELPEYENFEIEGTTIVAYTGKGDTKLEIPEGVEKIANYAFLSNEESSKITQISIPKTVKIIETDAFAGCTTLAELILDSENMNFVDVDGVIMSEDGTCILSYERRGDTSYDIPEGVKFICAHAFQMSGLKNITFPEGLQYIGYNAFAGLSLSEIYLPDSVLELAEGAFSGCLMAAFGYVSEATVRYDNTFSEVPFYMSMVIGQMTPAEEYLQGLVTIEEAIEKSDREVIMEQVSNIIGVYSGEKVPDGFFGQAAVTGPEADSLPDGVTLPDAATVSYGDLTVVPGQWESNVVCSLLIPCGGGYNMSIGFSVYALWSYYYWDEVKWRAETVDFVPDTPESGELVFGNWIITFGEENGLYNELTFTSADGTNYVREFRFPSEEAYRLKMSPDGNAFIIEYTSGGVPSFFIEDLSGSLYTTWWSYAAPCVPWYSKADGTYISGSAEWNTDGATMGEYQVTGESNFGKFLMNYKTGELTRESKAVGEVFIYYDCVYED